MMVMMVSDHYDGNDGRIATYERQLVLPGTATGTAWYRNFAWYCNLAFLQRQAESFVYHYWAVTGTACVC
jgi:hypothetical protein